MSSTPWAVLEQHREGLQKQSLSDLFSEDTDRFQNFSLTANGILLDYSKQQITQTTLKKLIHLAESVNLADKRRALFAGEIVNPSENRAARHTALRDFSNMPKEIKTILDRMESFVSKIHAHELRGSTGEAFTDLVCLGIGGSHLGPALAIEALAPYSESIKNKINCHFVSNVDGKTLKKIMEDLNPATTLCMISSKTFTTPETLLNAESFKDWLSKLKASNIKEIMSKHFITATAYPERAMQFGIEKDRIFEFWESIGGRYSVWSSVGLPIALILGFPVFKAFLKGAHLMDKHFLDAPFEKNMPVLMALLGIWNRNFLNYATQAILPYDDGLQKFPAFLQQLEMESNGKTASIKTAPVLWGGVGTDCQHSFMQLLHQGTDIVPVDFILGMEAESGFEKQQQLLVASCFSQSKALCEGNRPSTTILYPKLTPEILGSLIALYEHKVFVQAAIWGINPFDQGGVELGKKITKEVLRLLEHPSQAVETDSSTQGLIEFFKKYQRG